MQKQEIILPNGEVKQYSELTKEEVRGELKYFINHQLYKYYKSIVKLDNDVFKEDCIDYIYKRIDNKIFYNRKYFFVFGRSRMMHFYRKIKRKVKLENSFKSYYLFIDDTLKPEFDELCCLLYLINPKFKKFIPNNKFTRSKTNNLDFDKMKKIFNKVIEENNLYVNNKEELKKYIIYKYKEIEHLYNLSNVVVVEYEENEIRNNNSYSIEDEIINRLDGEMENTYKGCD
jgi:hypothetical protein